MMLITDLDGTLARAAWRNSLKGDWDAYHAASIRDKPNEPMIQLINLIAMACPVVCITTREERWRQLTQQWLLANNVTIESVVMRPQGDFRSSPELKVDLASKLFLNPPVFAIDDRDDVLAGYAALGFITLKTAEV